MMWQRLSEHSSRRRIVATILLCCLLPSVTAFFISQSQQPLVCSLFATKSQPDLSNVDPDQIRRRQLLVSLLTSASVTLTAQTSSATVTETPETLTELDSQLFRQVIVPPLDDSQYKTYTLRNGLRVLLCSDPTSNEAAAAMDVHVGACSDPVQVPGLAHFNEVRTRSAFLGANKVSFCPHNINNSTCSF
jgi:hypothetical protein